MKTMQANDKILIQQLTAVLTGQLEHYREMRDLVRKMLSRVILSRGDLSGVIPCLEKKKTLLDTIESERQQSSDLFVQWQNRKASIREDAAVTVLNSILDQTEVTIREFLDEEEQLKRYIEKNITKECSNTAS